MQCPEKGIKKIHKSYNKLKNEYEKLIYYVQENILKEVLENIEFQGKLRMCGWDETRIGIQFVYTNAISSYTFRLEMPNIHNIDNFDTMIREGYYEIQYKETDSSYLIIDRFLNCDDLKKSLPTSLKAILVNKVSPVVFSYTDYVDKVFETINNQIKELGGGENDGWNM